jgi:AcrR family transcriptional regulator
MKLMRQTVRRSYRQTARALAAEQNGARIVDAFERRIREGWFDQITLEQIAQDAGVTVQTVIRRFGGKEGLLEAAWQRLEDEIRERRRAPAGDVRSAVRVIVEDYEHVGDLVMRALAQEERHPAFKAANDTGRAHHRGWIEEAFAPWLIGLPREARRRRVDALVAATDLYLWKLVRRDMGRPARHVEAVMLDLVSGVIGTDTNIEAEAKHRD